MTSLTRESVVKAAAELEGLVVQTPAIRCHALEAPAKAELWLKAENLQYISAFKARGAMLSLSRLDEETRARGVITYSSGNHAQAVALAARKFGIRADIAMPVDAPKVKVDKVKQLGANIQFAGHTSEDRHKAALRIQARTNGHIVEPFDHMDTIAGQGTATLEFLAQVRDQAEGDLDALIVPVGGGGLIAGACLACRGSLVKIYSAEPVGCDAMAQSLAAEEIVPVSPGPTIADGLKPTRVGKLNFDIARQYVAGSYTVSDDEIRRALVALLLHGKMLVEPSAAAALAVALRGNLPGAPKRVGVILSGGNIDPKLVAELVSDT